MSFISYAQNLEDVMLWRALKHIEKGFYIDLGAWSPDIDSVTRAFYERGWSGINVEPNSEFHSQHQAQRIRDINLCVAIGDKPGTLVMNFLSNPGLSTLDEAIAQRHARTGLTIDKKEVSVTNLATLWKLHVPEGQDVHFLKVDVEGLEEAALRGNDWTKYRPWIVVIEATLPMSQEENHYAWEPILLAANYSFVYADGLNRFYLANEHAELRPAFKYPPNVFDEFKLDAQYQAELRSQQVLSEASIAIKAEGERAKWLESEWDASKNRVGKLTEELATAHDCAMQLEAQLADKSQEIDSANQALMREHESCKWLEVQWNATKKRLDELAGELSAVCDRSAQLEVQLAERLQEIDSANQARDLARTRLIQQENELRAEKGNIEELNRRLQASDLQVQQFVSQIKSERERANWLDSQLISVYNSRCWKITSPLRMGFDLIRWTKARFLEMPEALSYSIEGFIGVLFKNIFSFFLAHPAVMSKAKSLVRKNQRLYSWLSAFAISKGLIQSPLPQTKALLSTKFYPVEFWSGIPTRWMQSEVVLQFFSHRDRTANLSLRTASFYRPRTLDIYLSSELIAHESIPTEFIDVTARVKLIMGMNTLRLHVLEGSERPCDKKELNSQDSRYLCLAVQDIKIDKDELLCFSNSGLTPQAFRIYAELKHAIEINRRCN